MIYLASDHRGFELKEKIKDWLGGWDIEFEDLGPFEYNKNDDYPDFAKMVAEKVVSNFESRGILVCGSGIGIDVAANKIDGIRAGTIAEPEQVKAAVHDEDLNVISIAADFIKEGKAKDIVKAFTEAKYEKEERYERRLEKIKNLEEQN